MHVSCRESRRPHPGILEPPAAAGHDRDAISGEQLVPLRLAERRPYCRAACPRHRRLQLDYAGRTGAGHRRWRPAVRAEPGIGETFDHHCVQHTCPDGSYSFSERRQQPGCWSNFSHHAHGTKGFVSFDGGDAVVIQLKRVRSRSDSSQAGTAARPSGTTCLPQSSPIDPTTSLTGPLTAR